MQELNNIEQIFDNIFKIEVPIPKNPLKYLNSYLIKGERNLLIDLGITHPEAEACLKQSLEFLAVDMNKTDIFLTHFHVDHCGLLPAFATPNSTIYMSYVDNLFINIMSTAYYWDKKHEDSFLSGFPKEAHQKLEKFNPRSTYNVSTTIPITTVENNDLLEYGGYQLQCISTPGHTPGHMCLYNPATKILFAGDHILEKITPNITYWEYVPDSLGDYFKSLKKVYDMDITTMYTGHRQIITNHRQRIEQLFQHYDARLQAIIEVLKTGDFNAYQIASKIHWDLKGDFFDFPIMQQWFATGEVTAHLDHLIAQHQVIKKQLTAENIVFSYLGK